MIASLPSVPRVVATLALGDDVVDLSTRALVAGVVPSPRFGREGEVVATATAITDRGADLVDISLPPRLVGAASRVAILPVVARGGSLVGARAAARAGVSVVLVPVALVAAACDDAELAAAGAVALPVVDDVADVPRARSQAEHCGTAAAFDSSALSARGDGCEAAASRTGAGCCAHSDVRRKSQGGRG